MNYRIIIENKAEKESKKIPQKFRVAIDQAILELSLNPRPKKAIQLTVGNGYRIRIGNYRVLYTIDDGARVVVVYRLKSRSESTYKNLT
jgi:mRNA interferase RelE/StbE